MTPQDQEFIKILEIGQYGDCMRAVIASLLDLPIAEVPHFLQEVMDGKKEESGPVGVAGYIEEWLAERDYQIEWGRFPNYYEPGTYCFVSGPSPNIAGVYHACVGQVQDDYSVKLVHDPHPSKKGLLATEKWSHTFLTRIEKEAKT